MPIGCLCQRISFSVSAGFALCPLLEAGAGVSVRSSVQAALPALFLRVSVFPDLSLLCGKVTVVLLHNRLRLVVGCHERLHIGITVLFQNIGQFIQLFSDFLFLSAVSAL